MTANMWKTLIFRIVVIGLVAAICFLISGCSQIKDIKKDDPFRLLYMADDTKFDNVVSEEKTSVSLTLSAYRLPLPQFSRIISDKFGIGIVFSDSLSEKTITAEFKDTDLKSVFNVVARQIGVDVVRAGNTYFIGQTRPEDRGVLVQRILCYDQKDLQQILQSMISQNGRVQCLPNGIIVVTDHEVVLKRISEMFNYVDSVPVGTWIVQLYFVNLRKDSMLEGGLNTKSSGTLSYDIQNNKINIDDLKLDGVFSFENSSDYIDVFASPMLLLRDGTFSGWSDGERVPIPKKTVSQYGVVETTGFDYIDTGLNVNCSVRESIKGGILKLDISLSSIKSYVEYTPVISKTEYKFESDLLTNKINLIGELSIFKQLDSQQETLVLNRTNGKVSIQIWAKIYRVSAPVNENYHY